jgi:hypothetical protein
LLAYDGTVVSAILVSSNQPTVPREEFRENMIVPPLAESL